MSVAVPDLGRVCLRQLRRAAPQTRSFSSTKNRRKGPIATFAPTSSPELDAILNQWRENVFLPAHLRVAQRHLIFRKNHQHYLTGEEPVKVELPTTRAGATQQNEGEEAAAAPKAEFVLKPLDAAKDFPNFQITFNEIFNILKDKPEDWVIVPELLREWNVANHRIIPNKVVKIVRRAADCGRIGMMIECFRQVDTLGFRLSTPEIAQWMLYGAYKTAIDGGFQGRDLDKAIRHAEATMRLIQDKKHIDFEKYPTLVPPKNSPEIHGAALGLIAMRSWRRQMQPSAEAEAAADTAEPVAAEGEASDGVPETPAVKTPQGTSSSDMALLQQHALDFLTFAQQRNAGPGAVQYNDQIFRNCESVVYKWAPVWFGIQAAMKAFPSNGDLAKRLQKVFAADVDPLVQKAVADANSTLQRDGREEPRSTRFFQQLKDALP